MRNIEKIMEVLMTSNMWKFRYKKKVKLNIVF